MKPPPERACASALEPGNAPGLRDSNLEEVVQHEDLGSLVRAALVAGDHPARDGGGHGPAAQADVHRAARERRGDRVAGAFAWHALLQRAAEQLARYSGRP